ncbi:M61 family metallopeptidase [Hydrogenophaga soli]
MTHYRVEPLDLHAHLYRVTLTVQPHAPELLLSLPVWIPGSYLVREFAQHLQSLRADVAGHAVPVRQLDKHRWQVDGLACGPQAPALVVTCEVYAFDPSVRTAWLDSQRGFFNGTSLCLRVVGQEHTPQRIAITPPSPDRWPHTHSWQLATGLDPVEVNAQGFGTYCAPDYVTLVDAPVEMGAFWSGQFEVRGVPHRFVVQGAPAGFDGDRLLADTQRICEAEMAFWHGADGAPPFSRYVFMLNATHDGYGGLEHLNSTALIAPRSDLPLRPRPGATPPALTATDGYTGLLGLISHEYFHTWNVKRLRPSELTQPDLDRENFTELLWWFEGFTSHYDDLFLLRAGLIDTPTYLQLVAKTLHQVAQTPGRHLHSVAQASFEAWTKYYRVQENTPNATVSYYTKGALVGLCLDLTLRQHGTSLDHAMRALWQRSGGGPITEADIRAELATLAGRSLDAELDTWVHGTADLPVLELLEQAGLTLTAEPAPLAQRLGLRVSETQGVVLRNVLRGGLAEQAGMAAGDEWLAIQPPEGSTWRVLKLDDLPVLLREPGPVTAWVSRDRRILSCTLQWPGLPPASVSPQQVWTGDATLKLAPPASTPDGAPTWPHARA